MKSYTDLEQSKKLAKILPLESADMDYIPAINTDNIDGDYSIIVNKWDNDHIIDEGWIPCWSLSALLGILKEREDCNALEMFTNKAQLYTITTSYYKDASWKNISVTSDNLVDACYEMILKLHEQNLL